MSAMVKLRANVWKDRSLEQPRRFLFRVVVSTWLSLSDLWSSRVSKSSLSSIDISRTCLPGAMAPSDLHTKDVLVPLSWLGKQM